MHSAMENTTKAIMHIHQYDETPQANSAKEIVKNLI